MHLTRPPVEIPDRKKLGMASHLDASKGAYIIKDYDNNVEKKGLVIVRGTSCTNSVIKILEHLKKEKINVKIISAISWQLFRNQTKEYQQKVVNDKEWADSMIITNSGLRLMHNWISNKIVENYSMSPDHDNKWRTGGSVDEIVAESRLDEKSVLDGIKKFANERLSRLELIQDCVPISGL